MAVLYKLLQCFCLNSDQEPFDIEKHLISETDSNVPYKDNLSKAEIADEIIAKLFAAKRNDAALQADLKSMVHANGLYDGLAHAILAATEQAIKLGKETAPAVKDAYEEAVAAVKKVKEWAEAHPELAAVVITLIALGIIALMIPWLMAYLGFAEEGILEGKLVKCFYNKYINSLVGSWAACWQATFKGFVPKRSLFSYLQSLGTKIGRKWHG